MKRTLLSCFLLTTLSLAAAPTAKPTAKAAANPVELGTVNWSRDYDASLKTVASSGKPMLLLFQEVPG